MDSALMTVERSMTAMEQHAAYLEEKRDLILRTVCDRDTSPAELEFFLETCKVRGLNPLAKHIYFIRRSGRPTFQTSIDGYRLIASRTRQYAGSDAYEYDTESAPHPNRATCTVYRLVGGQRCAFSAAVRWEEYEATKASTGGKYRTKWDDMPYQMLGKCAESAALRKAFPEELSGLYTEDEMDQADRAPARIVDSDGVIQESSSFRLPLGLSAGAWDNLCARGRERGVEFDPRMNANELAGAIRKKNGPAIPGEISARSIADALRTMPRVDREAEPAPEEAHIRAIAHEQPYQGPIRDDEIVVEQGTLTTA